MARLTIMQIDNYIFVVLFGDRSREIRYARYDTDTIRYDIYGEDD